MALHKGTGLFIQQRLTGILNIALMAFFIWLVVSLAGTDRLQMTQTFSNPIVALLTLALLASALWHMRIGMGEIIEDYVHEPRLHALAKTANTIFTALVAVMGGVSVLVLAFGG